MKGRKGGESPAKGVAFTDATVPQTAKGNIMSAARKRKRGGAVAPLKVDGSMPKARLDKPKRARGGPIGIGASDRPGDSSGENYHDLAREYGIASPGKDSRKQSQQWKDRVDQVHSTAKRTGKIDAAMVKDASRVLGRPVRQRGGKVGADTSPMTHAARQKPMRGHSTQPNIT